ncbi:MAG TPA: ADP-forming succinate--CoA ligase subunit beta [Longilinea sp.]|nr:ADP-forming succinate--CoA ligase subunit beta [Longilinea sp.]
MKLHEYQSKQIFSRYGIPIPKGSVANTASEVKQIAGELGGKVVVKSQVLVGGRGKAGGIRLAKTPEEAEELAAAILAMEINGLPVRKVLVDEAINIDKEIYLGVSIDRGAQMPVVLASALGGVDIEQVAKETPEKIIRVYVDPLLGLQDYQARDIAVGIDLPKDFWRSFTEICKGLWKAFCDIDATLAEINPLVITEENHLTALDGKVVVDDNALFRHPDFVEVRDFDYEYPAEIQARKYNLVYIKLDGTIGCLVNGAGLAMASMDVIKELGGEPANFLDIGGGAGAEKVAAALRIILSDPKVKAIMINIFGGITRCDEVARGVLSAFTEVKPAVPVIVRLVGTNAEQGRQILAGAKVVTADTLVEAAKSAIELAKG